MSCQIDFSSNETIEWKIDPNILDKKCEDGGTSIHEAMSANCEYAGTFTMKFVNKKVCDEIGCKIGKSSEASLKRMNKGDTSSVKTSDGYCNFHTHPFSCYSGEKTVWGWPSGEDMSASVGFVMRGNLFHLVFTMEGIYCIQTNPNFMNILNDDKLLKKKFPKEDPSFIRGIVVCLIESYFKSTHGHRGVGYNIREHENKNKCICTPQDWVTFANKFKFKNFTEKKNTCSDNIKCNGVPTYSQEDKTDTLSFDEYFSVYGFDMRTMDKKGSCYDLTENYSEDKIHKIVKKHLNSIVKLFNSENTITNNPKDKWKQGQWFKVSFFPNEFKIHNDFVPFDEWLNYMCDEPGSVSESIHSFWKDCITKKNGAAFQFSKQYPVKVVFRTVKNKEDCTLSEKDNQLKKRSIQKYGNKKVSAFGNNKRKR